MAKTHWTQELALEEIQLPPIAVHAMPSTRPPRYTYQTVRDGEPRLAIRSNEFTVVRIRRFHLYGRIGYYPESIAVILP